MRTRASVPSLLAALISTPLLGGCVKTQFTIPVAQAPQLETGAVQTVQGKQETTGERYTVFLVPNDNEVLLRSPPRWEIVTAYPASDALRSPLLEMRDALPIVGPVRAQIQGENLEIYGPSDQVIVPLRSVKGLRITRSGL